MCHWRKSNTAGEWGVLYLDWIGQGRSHQDRRYMSRDLKDARSWARRYLGREHPSRRAQARARGGAAQACVSETRALTGAGVGSKGTSRTCAQRARVFMNSGGPGAPNHIIAGSNLSLCSFPFKNHSLPVHLGAMAFVSNAFLTRHTAACSSAFTWPPCSPALMLLLVALAGRVSILHRLEAAASTLAL